MALGHKRQEKVFLVITGSSNKSVHLVEIFLFKKIQIRRVPMEHHNVFQVGRQIVAAVLIDLDNFYRDAEFGKLFGQIIAGFPSADDHDLLEIRIFAAFVNLRVQFHDRDPLSDYIQPVFRLNDRIPMGNDDFSVPGDSGDQHIVQD